MRRLATLSALAVLAFSLGACSSSPSRLGRRASNHSAAATTVAPTTATTIDCANPGDAFVFTPGAVAAAECPQDFAPSTTTTESPLQLEEQSYEQWVQANCSMPTTTVYQQPNAAGIYAEPPPCPAGTPANPG